MGQITVIEHLLFYQKWQSEITNHFIALLYNLILAAKIISREVNKAGLLDILGFTGHINIHGEQVKKLDKYANDVIHYCMERSGILCALVSEENVDFTLVSNCFPRGEYILIFDPLDGSSNIDANVNVGTIFSILRRTRPSCQVVELDEILQKGVKQVGAGYIMYGTSTLLVYTTGQGVHSFTLDPSVGEFLLSHPNIEMPQQGQIYSINESYWNYWDTPTQQIVSYFKSFNNSQGKPYSLRYIGSLVADFHRTMLYGGIFMYPLDYRDSKKPQGKLRLLYEASPLAMLAEQAGGLATDGRYRILDLDPTELHQRVPLFIGSKLDVHKVIEIYGRKSNNLLIV